MGTIGFFMFHVVGVLVLVTIAVMIATVAIPRRPRSRRGARRPVQRVERRRSGRGDAHRDDLDPDAPQALTNA